jgi:isoleucyl-tRNA synthetase
LLSVVGVQITLHLDNYELDKAAKLYYDFVDDLSTWYARRSRDRFKADGGEDRDYALATTRYVLQEFSKLLAPFMPFIAEEIYQKVKGSKAAESVHLEAWPKLLKADEQILADMAAVREVISQALEQRASAGIKIRQPLGELTISQEFRGDYQQLILDEVNVKTVSVGSEMKLDTIITPELQAEGDAREFIRSIQNLRKQSNFEPNDVVQLTISTDAAGQELLTQFQSDIESVTNTKITFGTVEGEPVIISDQSFVVQLIK